MPGPEVDELAGAFRAAAARGFSSSPLYRTFCAAVADDPPTLRLLIDLQPGQQPTYLLLGAVQYLLLKGVEHPLAGVSSEAAGQGPVPDDAGPLLLDFIHTHREAVGEQVSTRLVQTNVVRRAVGLRYALSVIAGLAEGPAHLVEVGASAGVHLGVDGYRFEFGSRSVGPQAAVVSIGTQLLAPSPVDLDVIPRIVSRTGIDLRPVDVDDPDQRLWLRALVWPENGADAELLDQALKVRSGHLIAGDAIDVCPRLARDLPPGGTRIVFHAATRMHVPEERWPAFDDAIDSLGHTGPLFHVWQEDSEVTHGGGPVLSEQAGLFMHGPDGVIRALAEIDGHGAWIRPLA